MYPKLGPCFDGHLKDVAGNKFVTKIDLEEIKYLLLLPKSDSKEIVL